MAWLWTTLHHVVCNRKFQLCLLLFWGSSCVLHFLVGFQRTQNHLVHKMQPCLSIHGGIGSRTSVVINICECNVFTENAAAFVWMLHTSFCILEIIPSLLKICVQCKCCIKNCHTGQGVITKSIHTQCRHSFFKKGISNLQLLCSMDVEGQLHSLCHLMCMPSPSADAPCPAKNVFNLFKISFSNLLTPTHLLKVPLLSCDCLLHIIWYNDIWYKWIHGIHGIMQKYYRNQLCL